MTDRKLFGPEVKPWESPLDERLSPGTYGATALFGIVELACEHLAESNRVPKPESVGRYSQLFARVLIKAQVELGEGGGWSSALNARLRGALRTAIRVRPEHAVPAEQWEQSLYDLVISIAKTAAWLYARGPEEILEAGK